MVQSRLRLPRTDGSVKKAMRRRRLDLVSFKKEMVQDIVHFAQPYHIEVINEEFGDWGESVAEVLEGCSIKELMRIHKWMGLSEVDKSAVLTEAKED